MQRSFMLAAALTVLLFFIPWLWAKPAEAAEEEATAKQEEAAATVHDSARTLKVLIGEEVTEMDMETYLRGVVRAEMPASFEEEALKAQAVAARTYTLYKIEGGGSANHPEADACDDINCCKAYKSQEDAAAAWGMSAALYEEKIRRAVADTDGEVVLYEGRPVLAVFHSSSAGATRNVEDVWQQALPYLRSVASPEGADAELVFQHPPGRERGGGEPSGGRHHRHRRGDAKSLGPAQRQLYHLLHRRHRRVLRHRLRPRGGDEPIRGQCHGPGGEDLRGDSHLLLHRHHRGTL